MLQANVSVIVIPFNRLLSTDFTRKLSTGNCPVVISCLDGKNTSTKSCRYYSTSRYELEHTIPASEIQPASYALDRVSTLTQLYQYQMLWRSSDLRPAAVSANEPNDMAVRSVAIDHSTYPKCSLATHEDVEIVSWRDVEGFACQSTELMRRDLNQDKRFRCLYSKQEPLAYKLSLPWSARVLLCVLTVNILSFDSTQFHFLSRSVFTCVNRHMHLIVIQLTIMFPKTLKFYRSRTLLVHHKGIH